MQTLSKRLWKPSLFQAKRTQPDILASSPLLGEEDDFGFGESMPQGLSFRLQNSLSILIEWKSLFSLLLAVLIYLSAAFLANEWLYLLSSALVMAVVIGTVLPVLASLTIVADSWLPPSGIAHENSEIALSIGQTKWAKPFAWLTPVDCIRTRILLARRSIRGYVVESALSNQPILLESLNQATLLCLEIPLLDRGVYKLSSVEVATAFPFGMTWAIRNVRPRNSIDDALVVVPRDRSLNGEFLLSLRGQPSTMGLSFTETLALTQSTSVRSIREFRTGDSLRHIHWPSTAKLGKVLVREFDSETLPMFDLYLDLCANWRNREQFELAICLVASLIKFGFEHDISPELHLHPQIDSEELAGLMCDLPSGQAPVDLLTAILARVEPLPYRNAAVKADIAPNRELLSILPSSDLVMRGVTTKGQSAVVAPIHLVALTKAQGTEASLANHVVIATVYGEQDLETL